MRLAILAFFVVTLSAQTVPWPAIGPDVTGAKGPGNHTHDIPAKRCYRASSIDTSFYGPSVAITAISWASGAVTLTVASTAGFTETAIITVSGVVPDGYNGTYALSSNTNNVNPLTLTTLKYKKPISPVGTVTSLGSVRYTPNIIVFSAPLCYAGF